MRLCTVALLAAAACSSQVPPGDTGGTQGAAALHAPTSAAADSASMHGTLDKWYQAMQAATIVFVRDGERWLIDRYHAAALHRWRCET